MIYEAVLGGEEEVLVGSVAGGGRYLTLNLDFLARTPLKHVYSGMMALLACSIPRAGVYPALG